MTTYVLRRRSRQRCCTTIAARSATKMWGRRVAMMTMKRSAVNNSPEHQTAQKAIHPIRAIRRSAGWARYEAWPSPKLQQASRLIRLLAHSFIVRSYGSVSGDCCVDGDLTCTDADTCMRFSFEWRSEAARAKRLRHWSVEQVSFYQYCSRCGSRQRQRLDWCSSAHWT